MYDFPARVTEFLNEMSTPATKRLEGAKQKHERMSSPPPISIVLITLRRVKGSTTFSERTRGRTSVNTAAVRRRLIFRRIGVCLFLAPCPTTFPHLAHHHLPTTTICQNERRRSVIGIRQAISYWRFGTENEPSWHPVPPLSHHHHYHHEQRHMPLLIANNRSANKRFHSRQPCSGSLALRKSAPPYTAYPV